LDGTCARKEVCGRALPRCAQGWAGKPAQHTLAPTLLDQRCRTGVADTNRLLASAPMLDYALLCDYETVAQCAQMRMQVLCDVCNAIRPKIVPKVNRSKMPDPCRGEGADSHAHMRACARTCACAHARVLMRVFWRTAPGRAVGAAVVRHSRTLRLSERTHNRMHPSLRCASREIDRIGACRPADLHRQPRERIGVPARRFRAANVLSAIKACTELGVDDAVLIEPADLLEGRGTIRQPQRQHTCGAQRTNIGATVPRCGGHHAAPYIRAAVARHVGSTHLCGLDRKSIDSSTAQDPLREPVRAVCTFGYVQSILMRPARCAQAE
jgi:hypothetical protein